MKTANENLNDMELRVLGCLIAESDNSGYDFGYTEDACYQELNITAKQYSGYVSQLVQKGYITHPRSAKEDGYRGDIGDPTYVGMFELKAKTGKEYPHLFPEEYGIKCVIEQNS